MAHTYHRDDQDRKSQTSDYTTTKRIKKVRKTPLQLAQEAEIQSKTLWEIQKRYLDNEDEVDMTDERSSFLDDE